MTSEPFKPQLLQLVQSENDWSIVSAALPASLLEALGQGIATSAVLSRDSVDYSLFYVAASKKLLMFSHDPQALLTPVAAVSVPEALDYLDVFYLGGAPYIATYAKASSYLNLYRLNADNSLTPVHNQYVGSGFTMMHVLPYRDTTCVVLYNGTTGDCVKYQLAVPPYDGLSLTQVWSDVWAKTWGHFTFFEFGGENFFLKINQQHEKVNIDHFMDDPDEGSHPVLSKDADNSLLSSSVLAGFQGPEGQAYFLNYQYNGSLSLNSIYPNCLGWWPLASQTVSTGGTVLHPFTTAAANYLLILN